MKASHTPQGWLENRYKWAFVYGGEDHRIVPLKDLGSSHVRVSIEAPLERGVLDSKNAVVFVHVRTNNYATQNTAIGFETKKEAEDYVSRRVEYYVQSNRLYLARDIVRDLPDLSYSEDVLTAIDLLADEDSAKDRVDQARTALRAAEQELEAANKALNKITNAKKR